MKTKLFTVLLVAFCAVCHSQAQFSVGARAGFNLTTLTSDADGIKMKPGFQVGVIGDYAFSDAFSIQPGILYATQGSKV